MDDLFKELRDKATHLQDEVDGKNLEMRLLESELVDTTKPAVIHSQAAAIAFEMLSDVLVHISKKGLSDKAKESKDRLMKLNGLLDEMGLVMNNTHRLKIANNELFTHYQLLRVQNKDLRQQIKKMTDAQNF
jgi:hypothetical protein